MIVKTPSSIAAIRLHRQREERRAFQAYAAALKKWERARDRADDAAWEFQLACADLQEKSLAGGASNEVASLRRHCRQLQENSRRLQSASAEAKAHAAACFTALVNARNARRGLEECASENFGTSLNILPLTSALTPVAAAFQWN
jgi:hypothetical protein